MRKTDLLGLVCAASAAFGCYNTNGLKNGGLVCGDNGSCPTGFTCVVQTPGSAGHCFRDGTYADAGAKQDSSSPQSDASGSACSVGIPPYGPFAICSASQPIPNSTCDPVCQSGCACNKRCVLNEQTNTSFLCEATAQAPGTTFVEPMGSCEANTNSCAPGSVCIGDPVCKRLCYKTCRTDEDCGAKTRCTASTIVDSSGQAVKNLFFCSPPTETCNPMGDAKCATERSGFKCVFMAGLTGVGNSDARVCDCSSQHVRTLGQSCSSVPDNCQAGTVCISGTCRTVCRTGATGGGCQGAGSACVPVYGSATFGYCS